MFTVVLVVLLVCAAVGIVVAALPRLGAGVRQGVLAAAGFCSGLAPAGWLVPTWLTIRAGSASAAELGPWLLLLVVAPAYAVVPYRLAPPVVHAPDRTSSSTTVPPAGLPRGWSTTLTPELFRRQAVRHQPRRAGDPRRSVEVPAPADRSRPRPLSMQGGSSSHRHPKRGSAGIPLATSAVGGAERPTQSTIRLIGRSVRAPGTRNGSRLIIRGVGLDQALSLLTESAAATAPA